MNRISLIRSGLNFKKQILSAGRSQFRLQNTRKLSSSDYKPGDKLPHGWRVVQSEAVPELSLPVVVHLKHDYCGASLLHCANPDDETNAFCVHFKTVPQDSTGVAHVLEHVTLCGSEKFPVRDPFFKMLYRSLATFMNAMTGPDYTMYPFATQNKKDFYNLLSVYLDAVFNPLLKETDFRQEGWRLSEEKGKLLLKGVVFNEMKGAYADSQRIFGEALLNSILPSHTYGNESGGLPENIPDLTYENLKQFHRVHYSLDNAHFFTYGNLKLEDHLKELSQYLPTEKRTKDGFISVCEVPPEPRWTSPVRKHVRCPSDPSSMSNSYAMAFLVCDISDIYENFVMKIVSELLIDGPNAPFYRSLIEAGLGTGFSPSSGYESSTRDTIFSVGLQGISMDQVDAIESTIKNTFEEVCRQGFDNDRIEAILHRTELALKKQVNNFGLNLVFGLTPVWNHVEDPMPSFRINQLLERFRRDLKNPSFLTDKVRKYFIDNQHQLILTMSPDDKFVEEREALLSEVESKLIRNLSEADRSKVCEIDKKLAEEQSDKELENQISCLPTLHIEDIPLEKPIYKVEKTPFGHYCVQPTNGVSYFRALLSVDCLKNNETFLNYLPLFTMAVTQLGAGEKYNFREFDTITDLYTGGLGVSTHMAESPHHAGELMKRGLFLSSVCLERNSQKMLELWSNLFSGAFKTSPRDSSSRENLVSRLSQLINMSAIDAVNGIAHSGHHYAMTHACSKVAGLPGASIREKESGIEMVRFISNLSRSIEESGPRVFDILVEMSKLLLHGENIEGVALNMTESHRDQFVRQTEDFLSKLPRLERPSVVDAPTKVVQAAQSKKTYFATPFPVHYCGMALPAVSYTHDDSAPLRILAKLLSSKFLHPEIREKGGAYGGGATSNPISGLFSFYSYRDPSLISTLDTFEKTTQWVSKPENFTDRDILEAKLGIFQAVDRPILPGDRGLSPFLTGVTDEMFLEHRRRLLEVSRDDLIRVASKYLEEKSNVGISVIGPETSAKDLDSSWDVQQLHLM